MKLKKFLLTLLCCSLFLIIPPISVSAQEGQPIISDKNKTNPSTAPFFPSTLRNFQPPPHTITGESSSTTYHRPNLRQL